ncbi:unnamed protein product [Leuciscus chuanchicus]
MALSSNADVGAASSTRFKVHSVFAPTEAQKRKKEFGGAASISEATNWRSDDCSTEQVTRSANLEDSSNTNVCNIHYANHSSQSYGHTSEMHTLNVESDPEQPIYMDTFPEHLPEFVEEGTLDDNALFDEDFSIDDDLSFEDSFELNQEEGTELESSTNTKTDPKGPPRTHKGFVDYAKMAYDSNSVVRGVKGPTFLSRLTSYDLVLGTADECRKRWKSLRDTFRKERRKEAESNRSGAGASSVRPWRCSGVMGFLNPFLEDRLTDSNMAGVSQGQAGVSQSQPSLQPSLLRRKRAHHSANFDKRMLTALEAVSRRASTNEDSDSLFFQSLLEDFRTLSMASRVALLLPTRVTSCRSVASPSPVDGMINDAETIMDAREALIEASGILSLLGCPGFLHTLDQRQALVEEAARTYIEGRTQKAVEQLVAGLQELGIAEAIAKHPEVMKPLFVGGPKGLDMEDLQNLFNVTFYEPGSNRRRHENQAFMFWKDWLLEVDEGTRPVTLQQILIFASGVDNIPLLGFPYLPQLEFLHGENQSRRVFPEANTCQVVLRLPLHTSYDNFVKFMESGILQSPTFGVI